MISLCYKALILQGEIWCWSLLGLKELNYVSLALFTSSMRPPFLTHKYDNLVFPLCKKNSGYFTDNSTAYGQLMHKKIPTHL